MTTDTTEISTPTPPAVTISDIAFLVQVVEIVAQRGAFKAEELSVVGAVYDKVKAFIVANTQQPAPQPEEGIDQ